MENQKDLYKPPDAAFVICVEKGSLEYKALCLILSLRAHFGKWSGLPIYAYSPRPGLQPSNWLQEIYNEYAVIPVFEPLNMKFPDYALANKPLSMAHAETQLKEKYVIFLDTDICCWKEPNDFQLPDNVDLGLVVDSTKTVASSGPEDKYDSMWLELYQIAEAQYEPYVTTLLTDEVVRGWWCSGIIACRRSAGLMTRWLDVFQKATKKNCFPPEVIYLREQMTLCATVAGVYDRFFELSVRYNYPIQNHKHYSNRGIFPNQAVLWHYQPYLNKTFRKLGEKLQSTGSVTAKIDLAKRFLEKLHVNYASMIGLDETVFQAWRKKLKLGPRIRKTLGISKNTDLYPGR